MKKGNFVLLPTHGVQSCPQTAFRCPQANRVPSTPSMTFAPAEVPGGGVQATALNEAAKNPWTLAGASRRVWGDVNILAGSLDVVIKIFE